MKTEDMGMQLLEAIYGVSCNNPVSPSIIKAFVLANCTDLKGFILNKEKVDEVTNLLDDIINELKANGYVKDEFYHKGEFYFKATDEFAEFLGYDFEVDL